MHVSYVSTLDSSNTGQNAEHNDCMQPNDYLFNVALS